MIKVDQESEVRKKFTVSPTAKRVYILCPVRKATEVQKKEIEAYVSVREQAGDLVWYPARDTNEEASSLQITLTNCMAIRWADEVAIYYDPDSEGSLTDLGMCVMCSQYVKSKTITLINHIEPTPSKSHANLLLSLVTGETYP